MSATATGGHERGVGVRRRGPKVPARLLRLASDERLVEALRGGSEAAFEVLYTRHHRGILSFCRHMLGSAEEAEDAVQHTFLAAYRDLLRDGKPIRLRPWLYTIARNRCLSVLRARRERPSDEPLEPATEHLAQEVERRADLRALLGDLNGLPPDQRAALVLAELGDMSHDDIADVLACPREKVKALVFQARSSLIASRTARDTPCEDIRQQLANLRGGSLRRNTLRRHLRECAPCRDYRDQVSSQRDALAMILPVAPSLGLKAAVLGAAGVTAAAGGGASVVATAVVTLCVVGGGTAAVDIARDDDGKRPNPREPRPARVVPAVAAPEAVEPSATPAGRRAEPADSGRTRGRGRGERRGKGANPEAARPRAARPVRAQGPKAKPDKVRGPKPKAAKPDGNNGRRVGPDAARGAGPKAGKARGPRPKAEKVRPKPKAEKVAPKPKADKVRPERARPEPKAEEPAESPPALPEAAPGEGPPAERADPPGQSKRG